MCHQCHELLRIGRYGKRQINVGVVPGEPWRHDSEDCVRLSIQFERLADDSSVAIEVASPEEMADDDEAGRRGRLRNVLLGPRPAEHRRYPEVLKSVG